MTIQSDPVPSDLTDAEIDAIYAAYFTGFVTLQNQRDAARALIKRDRTLAPTRETAPALSDEQIIAAQLSVPPKNPDGEEWGPDEYDIATARAVIKADREQQPAATTGPCAGCDVFGGCPEYCKCGQRPAALSEAAELVRLREEVVELDQLRDKLAGLLSRTAIALRGPEPELTRWSWHDLPERAAAAVADRERAITGEPVAWRHSETHSLHDTEDEVQLADGDSWAEPLYLRPGTEKRMCPGCRGQGWTEEGDPEIGSAPFDCEKCGGSGVAAPITGETSRDVAAEGKP